MNSKYTFILLMCSGLVLNACSSNDDNGNGNNAGAGGAGGAGGGGETPAAPTTENALAVIGQQVADDEPLPLSAELASEIEAVFGDADNAPTDVLAGDNVQSVIDRAGIN